MPGAVPGTEDRVVNKRRKIPTVREPMFSGDNILYLN